jgi:alanine racemase
MSTPATTLSWVEIDADAVCGNIAAFRARVGGDTRLAAVVKANAYGHGLMEVARLAREAGAGWLAVNSLEEAVALREAGHEAPILVMGYVRLSDLESVVRHDLRPVVYDLAHLDALEEAAGRVGRPAAVHLKVETGTHRQGVMPGDVAAHAAKIATSPHLVLDGITTHFANIEDTTDHDFAESQIAAFEEAFRAAAAEGEAPRIRHTACSAATILFNRTHLDMVRLGISLYGLWPSRETLVSSRERHKPSIDLRPVMTWKTRVAQVKEIPTGSFVGYGCTWRATRPTRLAILPVGYHEGYDRRLSNQAHVLVGGHRAPVRGRVCMNITMVDVTDVPQVGPEDEVVLLGSQGDERVSAETLAGWAGTIHYEIVSRVHPSLPRVVVQSRRIHARSRRARRGRGRGDARPCALPDDHRLHRSRRLPGDRRPSPACGCVLPR